MIIILKLMGMLKCTDVLGVGVPFESGLLRTNPPSQGREVPWRRGSRYALQMAC